MQATSQHIDYFPVEEIFTYNLFQTAPVRTPILGITIFFFLCWLIRDNLQLKTIKEKYVFITGCDTGFGNLLAKQLDKRGFNVIAACFTVNGAEGLQVDCSSKLKTVRLNVTSQDNIQKAVEFVQTEVGGQGLWGLVNNAGRANPIGPTEWLTVEDFTSVLDVNLVGLINVTLHFLPLVKKAKGRIVNVSSVMGRISFAGGGYCLSKCGVESFSDSLRRDMQHFGIKVSIIEPGFFKTETTNLELIEKNLRQLWERLTPETRNHYGPEYFDNYIKIQRFTMLSLCSTDLEKVTSCMDHALTAKYPRVMENGIHFGKKLDPILQPKVLDEMRVKYQIYELPSVINVSLKGIKWGTSVGFPHRCSRLQENCPLGSEG
ncbi:retinol dehydrogenase 7-like isoform X2 [Scyliorhinus canicula]|uniref:retinol dehydrogenase 7-like isoform X2 n=1 Tax=Scyliorhinus canicula TaxID=7830 RepID=UPI0018F481ED|nr:retinol dehydrogenase 7-like isoform X2 [Scyliorhinus canicula]